MYVQYTYACMHSVVQKKLSPLVGPLDVKRRDVTEDLQDSLENTEGTVAVAQKYHPPRIAKLRHNGRVEYWVGTGWVCFDTLNFSHRFQMYIHPMVPEEGAG